MTIRALSHLLLASSQVPLMTAFFRDVFGVTPAFANDDFADFVLSSGARIALFRPVGASARFFEDQGSRATVAIGVTVDDLQRFYEHCHDLATSFGITFSGPPKSHPWGEPSFLLVDPDGNRWEVTQSPSQEGYLVNLES